ncbi:Uu.00g005300.m01.CDS01 [Anthostomella pinea]|uniref:Uu.00g005300.m01.CDS01 n=1 Tax=Anthostomella pinea TaxID=933095 RepID=A0AAI8VL93_9PEZI|nr:Uu.00g005300.m01.CDS01 [Anthostomella pinea]
MAPEDSDSVPAWTTNNAASSMEPEEVIWEEGHHLTSPKGIIVKAIQLGNI